mmetsp:Transcript_1356/g.3482  ORF Transcript_1356/g.3482 Transcript_1356/m.3482 type:complete len:240 (+) Transcript_1356:1248-1967(+)
MPPGRFEVDRRIGVCLQLSLPVVQSVFYCRLLAPFNPRVVESIVGVQIGLDHQYGLGGGGGVIVGVIVIVIFVIVFLLSFHCIESPQKTILVPGEDFHLALPVSFHNYRQPNPIVVGSWDSGSVLRPLDVVGQHQIGIFFRKVFLAQQFPGVVNDPLVQARIHEHDPKKILPCLVLDGCPGKGLEQQKVCPCQLVLVGGPLFGPLSHHEARQDAVNEIEWSIGCGWILQRELVHGLRFV